MDLTPLHPAIVHVPIGISLVLPLVAAALIYAIWRTWAHRHAWALAVALQAVVVGGASFAMVSGETEEKRVKQLVPRPELKTHEKRAATFMWVAGGTLALALAAMFVPRGRARLGAMVTVTVLLAAQTGFALWTGKAGGALVYQHGAAGVAAQDRGTDPVAEGGRAPTRKKHHR